ncbi:MAG: ribosomal-processing cysteine protease Prp [Faecalibacterium prausnitzii]
MIKIIYVADPEGGKLTMRAEGHAGYAPAGQDIVCAAVSCLMQTLAYSAAEDEHTSSCIYQGKEGPVVNVEAGDSVLMRDKFELVADGLTLLAEQYPENVNFKKSCKCSPAWTAAVCGNGDDRCLRQKQEELLGPRRQDASRAQQTPEPQRGSLSICSCLRKRRRCRCSRRHWRSCGRKGGVLPPGAKAEAAAARWMRCEPGGRAGRGERCC